MKHHLIVRADANSRSGTGHLMRSLALAQRWRAAGGAVTFLSHCESDALRQRIESAGMGFSEVAKPHPDEADLLSTLAALYQHCAAESKTWLALDGYHFDSSYQEAIRHAGYSLLVIDDMAHLDIYHADVLLNQNVTAGHLRYHCDSDTVLLLGTKYALLRTEFLSWREWRRHTPPVASKILVTLGGSDPDNVTERIIEGLKRLDLPCMEVRIVVGAANLHVRRLEQAVQETDGRLRLIHHTSEMPELMAWADLAISAAGSTCWELAFMGVPSLLVVLADNQRDLAAQIASLEAAVLLGEGANVEPGSLIEPLRGLIENPKQRGMLSARGRDMVDGQGAQRVVDALLN